MTRHFIAIMRSSEDNEIHTKSIQADHENDAFELACTHIREFYCVGERVILTLTERVQAAIIGGQVPPIVYPEYGPILQEKPSDEVPETELCRILREALEADA